MKLTKRLFTAGVALALTLSLNVPAFAATITVNNPAAGETYTAYKLFDVVTNEDKTAYSYSTDSEALVNALKAATKGGDGFDVTFTKAASDDIWYLTGLDTDEADDLAKYINTNWESTFKTILRDGTKGTTSGNSVVITVPDAGYYFVDSSLGSLCILNTTADSVTVNEKNSVPSITKDVYEDSKGDYIAGDSATVGEEYATIDVTDTVKYQLTVNTGTNPNGNGTGIDEDFVITDTLPTGFTYKGNLVVTGDGTQWTETTDYTVDTSTPGTLKITLEATGALKNLAQDKDIVITYDVTPDADAAVDTLHSNTVTLEYKEQSSSDTANVKTYDLSNAVEGTSIQKVDGDTKKALSGVKFILSKGNQYAQFDENKYLTGWTSDKNQATKLESDTNGYINAYGLDADTYILTETDTLPGYNLLADTITVTIDEDGSVTYKMSSSDGEATGDPIQIENMTGVELPSTGGMGTTVLYIAGVALALGAGITLVVRRRMNSDR